MLFLLSLKQRTDPNVNLSPQQKQSREFLYILKAHTAGRWIPTAVLHFSSPFPTVFLVLPRDFPLLESAVLHEPGKESGVQARLSLSAWTMYSWEGCLSPRSKYCLDGPFWTSLLLCLSFRSFSAP